MSDHSQTTEFDSEEAGRLHAQELISVLAIQFHTADAFSEALEQVRRVLLAAFDAVDPLQVVEIAWQNAMPEAIQRRFADESEQRRKERGSV